MLNFLYISLLLVITAAGFSLWRKYLLQQHRSGSEYLSSVHATPFGLIDVCLIFLVWILGPGLVAAAPLAFWGFPALDKLSEMQVNFLIVISSVAQLTVCLAAAGIMLFRYGTMERVFGASAEQLPSHFAIAVQAFCMVVPAVLFIQILLAFLVPTVPYQHDTLEQLKQNFSLPTLLATWFAAVIVAPFCEEILFRGVLQGWLQRIRFGATTRGSFAEIAGGWDSEKNRNSENELNPETAMNPGTSRSATDGLSEVPLANDVSRPISRLQWWMPVLVSSTMFAAVHIGQGLAPIALFVFALGLGVLYRITGSIVPSIILHFLLNAFSMSWATLETILVPAEVAI